MSIIATELTSLLAADTVNGYPATPTQVNGVNVSAVIECQSTTRAFLLPRMTTNEKNAIAVKVDGMEVFDTTLGVADIYKNGAWQGGFGNGNVVGPANSSQNGVAVFSNTTGKLIQAAAVAINPISAVVSGIANLFSSNGTAAQPTYSFTGDTNTGVYSDQADSIGIATGGALQLRVASALASVNHLLISGNIAAAAPAITAEGTDTNININLVPKGTGGVYGPVGSAALPGWAFSGNATSQITGMYYNSNTFLGFSFNGTHRVAVSASGVSIGTTTLEAVGTNVLTIASNGTSTPSGVTNALQIYAPTLGGNAGCLGLTMNTAAVTNSVSNVVVKKIRIEINNTSYYLLASDNAT